MNRPTLYPYFCILASSFAFSGMALFTYALGRLDCPWQIVAVARSSLALIFAASIARGWHVPLVFWKPRALWARSLSGSASMVCSFYALTHLRTADAITLTSTFTIWIALMSWPLEGRPPGIAVWLALVMSLAGVVLIKRPEILADGEQALAGVLANPLLDETAPAVAAALLAAFFSGIAMLGLHRIQGVDHLAIVVHFSTIATMVCLGAALTTGVRLSEELTRGQTPWLLLGVGLSATFGQYFLTKAFATGPPTKVAVVSLSQIVFALLLDIAVWGHRFNAAQLFGIVLIAGPSAWLMATGATEHIAGATEPPGDALAPGE